MNQTYICSLIAGLLMMGTLQLQAQALTFNLGADAGFPGDTVHIPIAIDSFTMITGYQGTLRWDSTVLEFLQVSSPTTGISNIFGLPGQGLIPLDAVTLTWVDFSGGSKSLPTGSVVIDMQFLIRANAPLGRSAVRMDSSVTLLGYARGDTLLAPVVHQGEVKVIDSLSSCAVCQNDTVYLDSQGQVNVQAADLDGGSNAPLGIDSLWLSQNQFDCAFVGSNAVRLFVRNTAGTMDSCMSMLTVRDTIPPTAICRDTVITLDSNDLAVIDVSMIDDGSSDNCGIQSISFSQDTFGVADIGNHTILMTVRDSSRNESTCEASVTVEMATSIEDGLLSSSLTSLNVYPNPVSDRVQIEWKSPWYGSVNLNILNHLGQEVFREELNKNESILQTSLDLQRLPTGTYVIRMMQEGYRQHVHLIKQ